MQPRFSLETDDIKAVLEAAHAEAAKNHWEVSIATVDDGGHLLGFLRLTGATPLSAKIAVGKARTAALSRRESKFYEEAIKSGRNALLSVADTTMLEGGVPVIVAGQCVAAVGVSGVKSDQDAQIALAGVKALLARQPQA
jgi:glc operon protein GlcG